MTFGDCISCCFVIYGIVSVVDNDNIEGVLEGSHDVGLQLKSLVVSVEVGKLAIHSHIEQNQTD